jgi:S-methylmethionine transporter
MTIAPPQTTEAAQSPAIGGTDRVEPSAGDGLRRSMGPRHLIMIAMGGVIGSGLFLSSGYTIQQAGPLGAVLAYLVGAFLVYLVMACLGELALAYPVAGAFHIYAARSIGPATGFTTAWLYWLCWAVALGSEFTASGLLMQRWFPGVAVSIWCLLFAAITFAFNAFSTRLFGQTEFWLSLVKVSAIVALIILGGAALLRLHPLKASADPPLR